MCENCKEMTNTWRASLNRPLHRYLYSSPNDWRNLIIILLMMINENNDTALKSMFKSDHCLDERWIYAPYFSPVEWTADSSLDNEQNGIIRWHLMNTLTRRMLNASGDECLSLCLREIVRLSPQSPDKATQAVTQCVMKRTNQHHGQRHTFIPHRTEYSFWVVVCGCTV